MDHFQRRLPALAGALGLLALLAGLLSVVPVLEEPDYLTALPARGGEVIVGALAQVLLAVAYGAFALALFPVMRQVSRPLSAGFLTLRLLAVGFHLLAAAMLPLFIHLGHGAAADAGTAGPAYEVVAETLRLGRDLVNHVVVIVLTGLGDALLLVALYRWRMVPRWLSLWGLLGVAVAICASLLVLSRSVAVVSVPYLALNAPLALHGLVLSVWLILRGVDLRR